MIFLEPELSATNTRTRKTWYTKAQSRIENEHKIYTHLTHVSKCIVCGDTFHHNGKDGEWQYPKAKYCSQRCRNDAYMAARKIKREAAKEAKKLGCGQNTPNQKG